MVVYVMYVREEHEVLPVFEEFLQELLAWRLGIVFHPLNRRIISIA